MTVTMRMCWRTLRSSSSSLDVNVFGRRLNTRGVKTRVPSAPCGVASASGTRHGHPPPQKKNKKHEPMTVQHPGARGHRTGEPSSSLVHSASLAAAPPAEIKQHRPVPSSTSAQYWRPASTTTRSTFLVGAIELRSSFAIDATPRATSTRATNVLCGSVHCPRTRATCFFLSCARRLISLGSSALGGFFIACHAHHATAPSSAHGRAVVLSTAHLWGDQRGSARRDSS